MKARTVKSFLATVCALLMVFSVCTGALAASTEETQRAAYNALPEDAIVCYIHGVIPVYKYEIDDNYIIHKDLASTPMPANSGKSSTLPTKHRSEMITASVSLVTTGYSQNESVVYMQNDDAKRVASKLGSYSDAAQLVAEITAATSTSTFYVALVNMFSVLMAISFSATQQNVESLATAGKKVELDIISTSYGTFASVLEWNGTSCVRYGYTESSTTVTVNSVVCENHGSVW